MGGGNRTSVPRCVAGLPERAVPLFFVPPVRVVPTQLALAECANPRSEAQAAVRQQQAQPDAVEQQVVQVNHAFGPSRPKQLRPERSGARDRFPLFGSGTAQQESRL